MTVLVRKTNGSSVPVEVNDYCDTSAFVSPSIFDIDSDLWDRNVSIPNANIIENEKSYKIELAIPGLDKKDIKIETDNGILTISTEKEEETNEENGRYKRREYSYDSFSRSFTLPENSYPDKIDAKYEKGILNLSIPKKDVTPLKPKKEIKVS